MAQTVYWYEHSCEWLTKYCDEHHRKSAQISMPAEIIDWIETELMGDDDNFRDIDVIIADARARFTE